MKKMLWTIKMVRRKKAMILAINIMFTEIKSTVTKRRNHNSSFRWKEKRN